MSFVPNNVPSPLLLFVCSAPNGHVFQSCRPSHARLTLEDNWVLTVNGEGQLLLPCRLTACAGRDSFAHFSCPLVTEVEPPGRMQRSHSVAATCSGGASGHCLIGLLPQVTFDPVWGPPEPERGTFRVLPPGPFRNTADPDQCQLPGSE